jgi:hypothetical protein
MKKFLKGVGVLLIVALMFLTTVAVSAITLKYEDESSVISIVDSSNHGPEIVTKPFKGGQPSLWDNGLPDGRQGLSCVLWPAYPMDREVIDDFVVEDEKGWKIQDGHFRIVTYYDSEPSAIKAVKVIFYPNRGANCSPDQEHLEMRIAKFRAYYTGAVYFGRREIAVDCNFSTVEVGPGRWWVCFQPEIDENCFWLTAENKECPIFVSYPGLGFPKWTESMVALGEKYDVSFRLTGVKKTSKTPVIVQFFELFKTQSLIFRFLQRLL